MTKEYIVPDVHLNFALNAWALPFQYISNKIF